MYTDPFGKQHRYGPPQGWVQPERECFNVDAEWQRLLARGLEFPAYRGPTQLRRVRGDCLFPLITDQHVLKVRAVGPDEALVPGRLYCIEWDNDAEIQVYRDKMGIPRTEKIVIMKFLYFTAFEWYAVCRESMARLGQSIVTGEVVGVVATAAALLAAGCGNEVHARAPACGNPFDAASAECSQLGLNAATQLVINNNNGAGSGITGITGLTSLGVVVSNTGPNVDCTVIVTATVQARQTAGTLGDVKLLVRYRDDGVTLVSSSQELKIVSASFQTYTLQWQFAHSRANAGVTEQASIWSDSGNVADSYDWQLATLQMEFVIR
jgi:hypothetical protein